MGSKLPIHTRFGRNASDYDLHETAGGLPLPIITAPNIHLSSKRRREVCKQTGKSNIPNIKCGSKRTHYAPSRRFLFFFGLFVKLIHDQIVDSLKFCLIFHSTQNGFPIFLNRFQNADFQISIFVSCQNITDIRTQ